MMADVRGEWRDGDAPASPPADSRVGWGGGAEGTVSAGSDSLDACMSRLASDCFEALRWRTKDQARCRCCSVNT